MAPDTMTFFDQSWQPHLDWSAPAGQVLDRLVDALPANRRWDIIVFDSAPLHLGSAALTSASDTPKIGRAHV